MLELPMEVADVDEMAIQQAHLYNEDSQHDKNIGDNVAEAHEVPREDWAVCASDSVKNLRYNRVERTVECANHDARAQMA